jgi:type II secretory pathway pseudopilin PulG
MTQARARFADFDHTTAPTGVPRDPPLLAMTPSSQLQVPTPLNAEAPLSDGSVGVPGGRRGSYRAVNERGFTLIEVLIACLVLIVGVVGMMGTLNAIAHTTRLNREHQAQTSLARELIEDARTLAYTQLTPQTLAGALQAKVAGASVSAQGLSVTRSIYTFNAALSVCSLDDPSDGTGNHSSAPSSGGSWCPDVAPNGTSDTNPDDYKRVSVTVTPSSGTVPSVQLTTLVYGQTLNGPAVSCLTVSQNVCPGTNPSPYTSSGTASITFYVTTTAQATSVQWLVNGNPPPSAQIGGGTDPYSPSATTSSFTWTIPTRSDGTSIDGTYTIAAYAQDANGATGSRSTLQVTVNEHPATAPTSITAGYDQLIGAVDLQWLPSTDQDVRSYIVYHSVNGGAPAVACQVAGTSCTDTTASNPGIPQGSCTNPPTDGTAPSNVYWVVGVDTNSSTGQPRAGTLTSPSSDANVCDHQPSAPSGLTATTSSGAVRLAWAAPSAPGDPDTPWDYIAGWRIYRWASGSAGNYAGNRLAYVGAVNGAQTATFTDSSPDPNGVTQNYCVTSVDTRLNESAQCSNVATG